MSAAAPRSCLKPPPRNPWVAEDGGESSTSSSQQQQQQPQQQQQQQQQGQQQVAPHTEAHRTHDLLAHQYATPYQATSAHSVGHPSLTVSYAGHNAPHSVSGGHTAVSVARATTVHPGHGVVHSHTAHSLHSAARPLPAATQSVHSVPGTLQQPWMDHQMLWSSPALSGVGGVPGGVYTVGAGPEGPCQVLPPGMYGQAHALHPAHLPTGGGGSSGQASSSAGGAAGWGIPPPHTSQQTGAAAGGVGVWGGGRAVGVGEGSRCERCHYYCFRTAQAVYVVGIVTGFSLLVAGGVFHGQRVAHLQVLVYIGAMVSLVCVVLLVIFCAMNKDHRTRRGLPMRFPGPQVVIGDPETVPLRAIDVNNPIVVQGDMSHARPGDGGSSMEILHKTNHSSSCMIPPVGHGCMVTQNVCYVGPTSHTPDSVASAANHGPPNTDLTHHLPQSRHPPPRAEDDCEANHRYNRLWKQPIKATSEAASKL